MELLLMIDEHIFCSVSKQDHVQLFTVAVRIWYSLPIQGCASNQSQRQAANVCTVTLVQQTNIANWLKIKNKI